MDKHNNFNKTLRAQKAILIEKSTAKITVPIIAGYPLFT